jgi:hypothetical protein
MSFVFSIPNIITQALRAMLREVQKATVSVLAERFGFSADEAMRVLDSNGEPDVVPDFIPLAAMPWIGVVDEDKCEAITFNKGLYTQCQGEKTAGNCCRKCANLKEKKGTFTYGDVHARMGSDPMEYKNVRPFLSAMEKNGWTEDLVTRSAQHYNGTVDPRNFKKKSRARGRPANAGMAAPPIPIEFETSEPQGEPPEAPASPPYVPAAESESESEDEDEIAFTEDYVNGLNKADLIVEGKRLGIELKENGKPRKMADVKEEIIRRFIHGDETIPA